MDNELLEDLKLQLAEEDAFCKILDDPKIINALEKRLQKEVCIFLEVLYNDGKALVRQSELNRVNTARVEVKIRRQFLEDIYKSRERYHRILQDIKNHEKNQNNEG